MLFILSASLTTTGILCQTTIPEWMEITAVDALCLYKIIENSNDAFVYQKAYKRTLDFSVKS